MTDFAIRMFETSDTEQVVSLWTECGLVRPWNDPYRDIARKLTVQPELFLVATAVLEAGTEVVGAGMAGFDGHRGWVNYLAVKPTLQGSGIGRRLMGEFEERLLGMGCPKLSLQVRAGNDHARSFYESLGYATNPAISMGKRLIPDA